jgi:hypothetical protein
MRSLVERAMRAVVRADERAERESLRLAAEVDVLELSAGTLDRLAAAGLLVEVAEPYPL